MLYLRSLKYYQWKGASLYCWESDESQHAALRQGIVSCVYIWRQGWLLWKISSFIISVVCSPFQDKSREKHSYFYMKNYSIIYIMNGISSVEFSTAITLVVLQIKPIDEWPADYGALLSLVGILSKDTLR